MKVPSKKIVYALCAFWDKDHRIIRGWFKDDDKMLRHPDSVRIIAHGKREEKLATDK